MSESKVCPACHSNERNRRNDMSYGYCNYPWHRVAQPSPLTREELMRIPLCEAEPSPQPRKGICDLILEAAPHWKHPGCINWRAVGESKQGGNDVEDSKNSFADNPRDGHRSGDKGMAASDSVAEQGGNDELREQIATLTQELQHEKQVGEIEYHRMLAMIAKLTQERGHFEELMHAGLEDYANEKKTREAVEERLSHVEEALAEIRAISEPFTKGNRAPTTLHFARNILLVLAKLEAPKDTK